MVLATEPLVTIVLAFRNGKKNLPAALNSILWQSYQNWELILINDGSTDGAEQLAKSINDVRIRFYSHAISQGLPACLNQGIALAKGFYIARMDADDIAFPQRLAQQVAFLQSHPEIDLLATSALLIDKNNQAVGILNCGVTHQAICSHPWHGFAMPHPTWMGPTSWFQQHPYDENAVKGQDQALLFRTYPNSRFAGLSEVLLGYRYEGLSVTKTITGRFYYLKALAAYGNLEQLLQGAFRHVLAVIRDIVCITLGLEKQVIRKRVSPINSEIIAEWQRLLYRMSKLLKETNHF